MMLLSCCWTTSLLLVLMMVVVVVPASAAAGSYTIRTAARREGGRRQLQQPKFQYPTIEIDETVDYQPPPRVVIEPFLVKLGGMSTSGGGAIMSNVDLADLLTILETVATTYLQEQSTTLAKRRLSTVVLEYVKFAQPVQVFSTSTGTNTTTTTTAAASSSDDDWVTVAIENGVARYSDHPAPTEEQVQTWVQESLVPDRLLPMLQSHKTNVNLRSVVATTTELKQQNPANADSPSMAPKAAKEHKSSTVGAIVGALVGAAIVAFAVLAFLCFRKLRSHSQVVNLGEATTDSDSNKPAPVSSSSSSNDYNNNNNNNNYSNQNNHNRSKRNHRNNTPQSNERFGMRRTIDNSHDGRSIAGSESEWTVATEAGDSMAIKSIHPNVLVPNSPNTSALMLSESFERDRQVAITKDMLTGQWSGNVTNQRGTQTSTESVLQPSYFSATVERQNRDSQRQQQQDTNNHHFLLPDMDSSSNSSSRTNSSESKKKKENSDIAKPQQDEDEEKE